MSFRSSSTQNREWARDRDRVMADRIRPHHPAESRVINQSVHEAQEEYRAMEEAWARHREAKEAKEAREAREARHREARYREAQEQIPKRSWSDAMSMDDMERDTAEGYAEMDRTEGIRREARARGNNFTMPRIPRTPSYYEDYK